MLKSNSKLKNIDNYNNPESGNEIYSEINELDNLITTEVMSLIKKCNI